MITINKKPFSFTFFLLIISLLAHTLHAQQQLPYSVVVEMASREYRYHHHLWHNIRNNWNTWDHNTQRMIRNAGWEPPRPARGFVNGQIIALDDNNSGEDFLYMHRQMINRFRQIIRNNNENYDSRGWRSIPQPGDPNWPVPESYQIPGGSPLANSIDSTKTNNFYYNQLLPMEETFTDYDQLRSMTLGEMGSRIENTVHNWLHLRFSTESYVGYKPRGSEPFPYIDPRWDDPSYDWLADTYSSQVNPVFWKLHDWIEDRIEDWRRANGLEYIEWTGTWVGGPMDALTDILQLNQNCPFGCSSGEEEEENLVVGVRSGNNNVHVTMASVQSSEGESGPPQSSFADNVPIPAS